ncbi:uncharacterized protein A4U43_C09F13300 [Asparagus officinalis]|uniref:Uncharacterized protein n=1 Tax=Asparagus officinalis TaxID=4686 RepID=A0A5P1E719_ASPOF|nr:uncharacterized protein A4U43_C09F13300 [Asparagus officinalis]
MLRADPNEFNEVTHPRERRLPQLAQQQPMPPAPQLPLEMSVLYNARDGFGDDEIEHEMMSGSSQNFKIRRDYIKRKERAIKQRLDKAMADLMRERGKKDYEKPGRHGSEEKTKVPPKGYRAILEWKGNIPVGDWAVRFNNLIGCLIRDPCSINIAHNFEEQEFKGIKEIWVKLMDHYCLEDNLESWDYVIPKMAKLIRGWKSDLKKRYFTKISTDWKRIYELDKRVYPFNWMTLIIEWEGEKKVDYF